MKLSEIANRLGVTEVEATSLLKEAGLKANEVNEADIPDLLDLIKPASVQKTSDTMTVQTAREIDPDSVAGVGGIVPSQSVGMAAAGAGQQPISFVQPPETINIDYGKGVQQTTQNLEAVLAGKLFFQKGATEAIEVYNAVNQAAEEINELKINLLLMQRRLPLDGTLQERVTRLNRDQEEEEYKQQLIRQKIAEIDAVNQGIRMQIPGMAR